MHRRTRKGNHGSQVLAESIPKRWIPENNDLNHYGHYLSAFKRYTKLRSSCVSDSLRIFRPEAHGQLGSGLRYFMRRSGKCVRGVLVLLTCELAGGSFHRAIKLAAAIEFLHAASLLLDDLPCMDNAATRRGQPCVHLKYGESTAILCALLLINRAFGLLAEHDNARKLLSIVLGNLGANGLVGGQFMSLGSKPQNVLTQRLKTGRLFEAAAAIGLQFGHADAATHQAVLRFAAQLGIAYQMRDDVIDRELPSEAWQIAVTSMTKSIGRLSKVVEESYFALALGGMGVFAVVRDD